MKTAVSRVTNDKPSTMGPFPLSCHNERRPQLLCEIMSVMATEAPKVYDTIGTSLPEVAISS